MNIKIEFTSKNLQTLKEFVGTDFCGLTIKPIFYDIKQDAYGKNKFNIFSIRNKFENVEGTKQTEALEALNIYNNSTG